MYNEIEKLYKEKMSLLTEKEKVILELVILDLDNKLRQKAYVTGDKNLFMRKLKNIKKVEVENELTGETITICSKSIMKAFKKFKKIRLLAMDQNGLPLFLPDIMPQLSF